MVVPDEKAPKISPEDEEVVVEGVEENPKGSTVELVEVEVISVDPDLPWRECLGAGGGANPIPPLDPTETFGFAEVVEDDPIYH